MNLVRDLDASDWVRGSRRSSRRLIEYGDFECPSCGQAYPELKRLFDLVGDQVAFAFRHFPIAQLHPHARMAAEAAEAAGAQGRFWEMHDLLFENQEDLEADSVLAMAESVRLDLARFSSELSSHRHQPRVQRDFMEGVRSGVNGTPTFFIDGERFTGVPTAEGLLEALRGDLGSGLGFTI